MIIIEAQNKYILWLGVTLLACAIGTCVYRLVRAGLLSAGLDEKQSRVVAIVLIASSSAYALSKFL